MKVAYVCHFRSCPESGVSKKIRGQAISWTQQRQDVAIFQYSQDTSTTHRESFSHLNWNEFPYGRGVLQRVFGWKALVEAVVKWQPDVVYFRHDWYSPALEPLLRRFKVVVEVNTDDTTQAFTSSLWGGVFNRLTRSLVFRRAAGIVFVSHEISNKLAFNYRIPKTVIGNPIQLDEIPEWPANRGNGKEAVMIGNPECVWQGMEHFCTFAAQMPDWHFHLIGGDGQSAGNLTYHGFLRRDDYQDIFRRCSVGFGSLAQYRIGVNEISPLKTREYLAFGLPVVIAYRDTDFLCPCPFVCEIRNTSDSVTRDFEKIRDFMNSWVGRRVDRPDVQHLDTSVKEAQRIRFLESVIENSAVLEQV